MSSVGMTKTNFSLELRYQQSYSGDENWETALVFKMQTDVPVISRSHLLFCLGFFQDSHKDSWQEEVNKCRWGYFFSLIEPRKCKIG